MKVKNIYSAMIKSLALETSWQKFGCQLLLVGLLYKEFPLSQMNKSRYYKKLWFFVCCKLNGLLIWIYILVHLKQLCSISTASCWVSKLKRSPLTMNSSCFKTHKKSEGSTGFIEFFCTAMLGLIAHDMGKKVFNSEGTLFQKLGTTLKICKMEFA